MLSSSLWRDTGVRRVLSAYGFFCGNKQKFHDQTKTLPGNQNPDVPDDSTVDRLFNDLRLETCRESGFVIAGKMPDSLDPKSSGLMMGEYLTRFRTLMVVEARP